MEIPAAAVFIMLVGLCVGLYYCVRTLLQELEWRREDAGKAREYNYLRTQTHVHSPDLMEFYRDSEQYYRDMAISNTISACLTAFISGCLLYATLALAYQFVVNTNW